MARSIVWLVLLAACAEKPKPTPTPAPVTPKDERRLTIVVESCLPVGYGEHCAGNVDGRPVSLMACVGPDAVADLTSRLAGAPIVGQDGGAPVTITLEAKSIGVLDAAYSTDYCGGLLFGDSKEQLHVTRVVR